MERRIAGVAASEGIAIGAVKKLWTQTVSIPVRVLAEPEVKAECARFRAAVAECRAGLRGMIGACDGARSEILEAHLSILEDPFLEQLVIESITGARHNAERALQLAVERICGRFETLDDETLRSRADDLRDEGGRIQRRLLGIPDIRLDDLPEPVLLLARDLAPSDTAGIRPDRVLGIATELGGKTSHTAIMARGMGIPAVVGAGAGLIDAAREGDTAIIDGGEGMVLINPDKRTLASYRGRQRKLAKRRAALAALSGLPALTRDGHAVVLSANIGSDRESSSALAAGVDGVGLLRSEFLYMEADRWPTWEEQFAAYRHAAKSMQGRPVVIRTLDIGGDKRLPYHDFPPEENPFLGHRAIRFCLANTSVFQTQLSAILRASVFGDVRVLLPMVTSIEEVRAAKALLRACMEELDYEGIAYNAHIPLGIMIETPAAVLTARGLAREADFFSIGTNDLTQYVLAADRGNERVGTLYNPLHPAVLAAIRHAVDAAHAAGIPAGMCGELAGDPLATPLLLGMGLDEFSVAPPRAAAVKERIRAAAYDDCAALAKSVLRLESAEEIAAALQSALNESAHTPQRAPARPGARASLPKR